MKWKLSLPENSILVYYCVKLLGLAPFTMKNNRFYAPTILDKLYPVFLAATHFFVSTMMVPTVLRELNKLNVSQLGFVVVTTRFLTINLSMLPSRLIFLFMYKKILNMMNKLCDIDDGLKTLGVAENQEKFFKNVFVTIIVTNFVVFVICIMTTLVESDWLIIFTIKYNIETLFSVNEVLIFTLIMSFMKRRFALVNENFYNAFTSAGIRRSLHNSRMLVVHRNPREVNQPGIEDLTGLQRLRIIQLLHFDLCDLVDQTTNLFGIPILFKSLILSTEVMANGYWIYMILQKLGEFPNTEKAVSFLVRTSNLTIKMVIAIVQILAIAQASVKTCEEGNATKAVLSKVRREFKPQELEDECFLFSLQLMHKSVAVSAFGFFDLGYSYVYKIFCAVVAYLIVLIQFNNPEPNVVA